MAEIAGLVLPFFGLIFVGYLTAKFARNPAGEGAGAVEALIKLKKGEKVESIINIPITIVTKDNVEPYKAIFK